MYKKKNRGCQFKNQIFALVNLKHLSLPNMEYFILSDTNSHNLRKQIILKNLVFLHHTISTNIFEIAKIASK